MANAGPKPWTNPFPKILIFRLFEIFVFIVQLLECHKTHYPNKEKMKKWPILDHNHVLWKNLNYLTFKTSCFYSLERLFLVLEYHKTHYNGYISLKKRMEIWPILDPKSQFFEVLNLLFLQSRKAFFPPRRKQNIFSCFIQPKKNIEKWPLLVQNH